MKKQLISIYVALGGMLFASSVDVNVSQGTDQSVIASLTPAPASREVDADTNIKLCFNEPLLPMRMPHSVTLTKLQENTEKHGWFGKLFGKRHRNTNERIRGNINYDSQDNCLVFDPDNNLSVGFYEVETKPLMIRNRPPRIVVSSIRYRFYVPEVINGFKLPPEPDEDKNNETLLGIDFNHNGIRDDVERWVIVHYDKDPKYPKTKTAIALQYAWAAQKILENPTMESKKYLDDAVDCQYYWLESRTKNLSGYEFGQFSKQNRVYNTPELKDKIYNTKLRIEQKFRFNFALSGNIFNGRKRSIKNCQIDIDNLGE